MRPLFLLLAVTAGSLGWTPDVCLASDGSTTADAETVKPKNLRLECAFSFTYRNSENSARNITISPAAVLMSETPISSRLSRYTASKTQSDPEWFDLSISSHSVTVSYSIYPEGNPPPAD